MTHPARLCDHYDSIVIGSSPLMLLHALTLARSGQLVCLVDRPNAWGGAWQVAQLENGEEVEIACHVIEVFPGVYDLLADYSGVPFETLDAQPIRVHPSGIKVAYFSRLLLIGSGLRLMLGYSKAWMNLILGRAHDRNQLLNFKSKLTSYLRDQLPSFFRAPLMEGPRDGFVDFLAKLMQAAKENGIHLKDLDVSNLRYDDGKWLVNDAEGQSMSGTNVHVTTSVSLARQSERSYQARPVDIARRETVVVDIALSDINTNHTYVAFWKDKDVARISRVDTPDKARSDQRFLVEFHQKPPRGEAKQMALIETRLRRADILREGASVTRVGQVTCEFTQNIDQLPAGKIGPGLFTHHSSGNLAAGIATWQKTHLGQEQ